MSEASSKTPTKTSTSATIHCALIQLGPLSDSLQSLMALRAAKQLYPNLVIHYIVREQFKESAERVPWLDHVTALPSQELFAPVVCGQKSEEDALKELARWIAPLTEKPWDLVVNWSYSDPSSFLAALLPGRIKLGYSRSKDTSLSAVDGWSHYIQAVVQSGIEQNIHLTDIFTTQILTALQIHFGEPADAGNSAVTSKSFFALEIGETDLGWSWRDLSRKWIGIQIAASKSERAWSSENWAKLASLIFRRNPEYGIVLLGEKGDLPLAKEFRAEMEKQGVDETTLRKSFLSLVGESDFDLWASVISRCHWLFSADSPALHLASVLGTRVLNICAGSGKFSETGPYGNGHYLLTSLGESDQVSPEAVYASFSYAASEWAHRKQLTIESHFQRLGYSDHLAKIRILRSRIRNTQDGGGVVYESALKRPLGMQEWASMVMGYIARAWYCGWVPPIGQELTRDQVDPTLVQKLRQVIECSQVLTKICDEAKRTSLQLKQKASSLKSTKIMNLGDREEVDRLGATLKDLDLLLEKMTKTEPSLAVFERMSKVLMHNLRGDGLMQLGKESADCYRQIGEGVAILKEWAEFTLRLSKPVAVSTRLEEAKGKELNP